MQSSSSSSSSSSIEMSVLERQKAFLHHTPSFIHSQQQQQQQLILLNPTNIGAYLQSTETNPHLSHSINGNQCNSDGHGDISRKRKAQLDVEVDDDFKGKIETEIEAEKSEITTTKKSTSSGSKPDYIHVRARRGQATDSHSLAERARREKISKKMKCLQDLVPGCNKVSGKAGMLDEIINYVQSLQKQVEFLSMKLATLNPRLDCSMDHFLAKEIPAYISSLPAVAAQIETMNNMQYTQMHSNLPPLDQSQMLHQKPGTTSIPIPEGDAFLDSSYMIPQLQQLSGWESDWPNLFNVGFH